MQIFNEERVLQISPALIQPNPFQPRKEFDAAGLEDLKNSIKEHGIIQPLVVIEIGEGHFQLVVGERRLRASQLLGLERVPVIVREKIDDRKKLELSLIENLQREDLSSLEKAVAYKKLAEEFNLSHQAIAERMGISRPVISNTIRLLGLPEAIKKALNEGKIFESHCWVILGYKSEEDQMKIFSGIVERNLPTRFALKELQEEREKAQFSAEPYGKTNFFTTPTTKTIKDFDVREKEENLREALGTKVEIEKRGQQGKIVIEFYSNEELENIISKICF